MLRNLAFQKNLPQNLVHTRLALAPFCIIAANLVIMQSLVSFLCIRNRAGHIMYNVRVPTDSKVL